MFFQCGECSERAGDSGNTLKHFACRGIPVSPLSFRATLSLLFCLSCNLCQNPNIISVETRFTGAILPRASMLSAFSLPRMR